MELKIFIEIPPWEWPEDANRIFLEALRDNQANESEHLLAAEMAGDSTVINDELAGELLAIVNDDKNSVSLRGRAAISIGPALEYAFIDGKIHAAGRYRSGRQHPPARGGANLD